MGRWGRKGGVGRAHLPTAMSTTSNTALTAKFGDDLGLKAGSGENLLSLNVGIFSVAFLLLSKLEAVSRTLVDWWKAPSRPGER